MNLRKISWRYGVYASNVLSVVRLVQIWYVIQVRKQQITGRLRQLRDGFGREAILQWMVGKEIGLREF